MKTRFRDSSSNLKVKKLKTKTTKPALIQMQASVYIYNLQKRAPELNKPESYLLFLLFLIQIIEYQCRSTCRNRNSRQCQCCFLIHIKVF